MMNTMKNAQTIFQAELANRERQKSELEEEKAEIDRHLAAASERQKQAGEGADCPAEPLQR